MLSKTVQYRRGYCLYPTFCFHVHKVTLSCNYSIQLFSFSFLCFVLLHHSQGSLSESKNTGVWESAASCCMAGCGGPADGICSEPLGHDQNGRYPRGKNSVYKSQLSRKQRTQRDVQYLRSDIVCLGLSCILMLFLLLFHNVTFQGRRIQVSFHFYFSPQGQSH